LTEQLPDYTKEQTTERWAWVRRFVQNRCHAPILRLRVSARWVWIAWCRWR